MQVTLKQHTYTHIKTIKNKTVKFVCMESVGKLLFDREM